MTEAEAGRPSPAELHQDLRRLFENFPRFTSFNSSDEVTEEDYKILGGKYYIEEQYKKSFGSGGLVDIEKMNKRLGLAARVIRFDHSDYPELVAQKAYDLISFSPFSEPMRRLVIHEVQGLSRRPGMSKIDQNPIYSLLKINEVEGTGIYEEKDRESNERRILLYFERDILRTRPLLDKFFGSNNQQTEKTTREELFSQARQQFIHDFGKEP
jgi:hypothetical protein